LIRAAGFTMIPRMPRHQLSSRRPAMLVLALAGTLLAASSVAPPPIRAAQADDLLAAAATASRSPAPVRADVTITRDGATAKAVIVQRGATRYIETAKGTRALVKPGKIVVRDAKGIHVAAPDATVDDTNIGLNDLAVVSPSTRRTPQVSDTGPMGTVVTFAPPTPSPYVLVVETFDASSAVLTRAKYYEGEINNLVKLRRDGGYTEVARRPKPGEIVMDTVRPAATTTLTLVWTAAPDDTAPALATLRGPSLLAR
jgi:hypothetical protein